MGYGVDKMNALLLLNLRLSTMMISLASTCLLLGLLILEESGFTVAHNLKWELVDSFEFDYKSNSEFHADPRWVIDDEPENLCSGENIYQYSCHRAQNVRITPAGHMEIVASMNHRQGHSRFFFNSGKIASNQSWLYGRFELRAMLPEGKLLRSVFVLKPRQYKYQPGDWLSNGQINGLVYAQQGGSVTGGIHYHMPDGLTYNGRKFNTQHNLTTEFHRYAVEWTDTTVRWLFDDDVIFFETNVSRPFDQPFYFVLQLGVGGPEFDTRYSVIQSSDVYGWRNSRFVIDYVKVYQQVALLSQTTKNRSQSLDPSTVVIFLMVVAVCIAVPLVSVWFDCRTD